MPHMVLVWLVGYTHGSYRMRVVADAPSEWERQQLVLPHPPWLQARLQARGWSMREALVTPHVLGLADLEFQEVWHGPLTCWGAEANLLHAYFKSPMDAVACLPKSALTLLPCGRMPVAMPSCLGLPTCQISHSWIFSTGAKTTTDAGHLEIAEDAARRWGYIGECVNVPSPSRLCLVFKV